jgi:release factor glutamine methyltransferase
MKLVSFLGVEIETGPGALVPREETELCGRTAIARLRESPGRCFVDVCCGTGNLACAIATAISDARGWALELTEDAVALARKNVARLGLGDRIEVAQGDLFAPLGDRLRGEIDVISCNPPYLATATLDARPDLANEPREAFDGGQYGFAIHQRVAREALALLKPGGWLVMEIGLGQDRQVMQLVKRARDYDTIEFHDDANGAPRVVAARRKS